MKTNRNTTNKFAKDVVFNVLTEKGLNVDRNGRHFLINNQQKLHTRGCNYDNDWARQTNCLGGWDKLKPEQFDYLVCVSFDGDFNDVRYFIFTQREVQRFLVTTLKGKDSGLKNLILFRNNKESDRIIKSSENKWNKITVPSS